MSFELETLRLRLVPLTRQALRALSQGRAALSALLDRDMHSIQIPSEILPEIGKAIELQRENTEADPQNWLWHTDWEIVLEEENRAIGACGFAGPPSETGEVFMGYWMDPRYQRKGFMTEALGELTDWALAQPHVARVTATTPAHHLASQRVLQKNGFVHHGELDGMWLWVKK